MTLFQRRRELFRRSSTLDKINHFYSLLTSRDLAPLKAFALLKTIHSELQKPKEQTGESYMGYSHAMQKLQHDMPDVHTDVVDKWSNWRRTRKLQLDDENDSANFNENDDARPQHHRHGAKAKMPSAIMKRLPRNAAAMQGEGEESEQEVEGESEGEESEEGEEEDEEQESAEEQEQEEQEEEDEGAESEEEKEEGEESEEEEKEEREETEEGEKEDEEAEETEEREEKEEADEEIEEERGETEETEETEEREESERDEIETEEKEEIDHMATEAAEAAEEAEHESVEAESEAEVSTGSIPIADDEEELIQYGEEEEPPMTED